MLGSQRHLSLPPMHDRACNLGRIVQQHNLLIFFVNTNHGGENNFVTFENLAGNFTPSTIWFLFLGYITFGQNLVAVLH